MDSSRDSFKRAVKAVSIRSNRAIAKKPNKNGKLPPRGREVNPNELIPLDDAEFSDMTEF